MNRFIRAVFPQLGLAVVLVLALGSWRTVLAVRPPAHELLPDKTVLLIRIADVGELVDGFRETATGRMFQDEQMKPFVSKLYGNALQAFEKVQDNVGLPLHQLLAIPQGEVFFAILPKLEGPPTFVFLIEVKDQLPAAMKLLDKVVEESERKGATKSIESVGDTKLTILNNPDSPQPLVFFEKDGAVVVVSNVEAAKKLHSIWTGPQDGEPTTLATNRKFTAVMNRCQGSRDERPHVTFYIDPIEFVRATMHDNTAVKVGMAVLPTLGLDGLLAFGGSMRFISGEFDHVTHYHLLLESPRAGVIKALALESGDSAPEPWVPRDISGYSTFHWNVEITMREVARLMDGFRGEGAYAAMIRNNYSDPLGVDFEKDILSAIDTRGSYVTRFEKPIRYNSQSHLIAVKLKDAKAFRPTLEKMIEKFPDRFEKKAFGGISYYLTKRPDAKAPNVVPEEQPVLRTPDPCLGILGDYLMASDSASLLRQCILAKNDPEKSLAEAIDFKLINSKIARQAGGGKPAAISFGRPEEGMRYFYELANAEGVRKNLAKGAENNEAFKALQGALNDHPLPPFSVIEKYFAPGGSVITNEETGFHYTEFALRRK